MRDRSVTSAQLEAADALEAIELYFKKGWTDGLPVVPPTPEHVQEFLDRAGLEPQDVIGAVPTRGRVITAEKAAINAVMAGCLPEYLPVVVAALKAMTTEDYNLHGTTASTMGAAPLIVVNGPVRERIGLNWRNNLFGPGVRANATIGRAVRLVLLNVCGATPGVLDMAVLGQPAKYTYCIAEDEHPGTSWHPLHTERGYGPEQSTVTVFPTLPALLTSALGASPQVVLRALAGSLCAVGPSAGEVIIVLPP
ncbi:MAG: TlpA family protein disulfide reductase, partial [Chloroflexi bacterium]|nr:TlpA family protein disulfide reductase [Chloroflexota bacterium]